MTRRPAHPINCDCCICVDRRQLAEMDKRSCSRCKFCNKCDGRLRVVALTDSLAATEYLDPKNKALVDALAKSCLKWRSA